MARIQGPIIAPQVQSWSTAWLTFFLTSLAIDKTFHRGGASVDSEVCNYSSLTHPLTAVYEPYLQIGLWNTRTKIQLATETYLIFYTSDRTAVVWLYVMDSPLSHGILMLPHKLYKWHITGLIGLAVQQRNLVKGCTWVEHLTSQPKRGWALFWYVLLHAVSRVPKKTIKI